jgi:hypothetical protein
MGDERGSAQILKQKMPSKKQDLISPKESTCTRDVGTTCVMTMIPVQLPESIQIALWLTLRNKTGEEIG